MEALIDPVDCKIIENELKYSEFLRVSRMGNNELYSVDGGKSPSTIDEIGRLRELTFRHSGGGIGASKDIDNFDMLPNGYKQLVVWDPKERCILGGYRFRSFENDQKIELKQLATGALYDISPNFENDYLRHTIDLGRAFIKPVFQTKQIRKNLHILDNLWDGLGTLIRKQSKYFLGRIVLYPNMNKKIRDLIIYFLEKHFNMGNGLLAPIIPFHPEIDRLQMEQILDENNPEGDFKKLRWIALAADETIPPLIQAYMKLSPTMQSFGATIDTSFGNLYEICIMITIQDIYPKYLKRYSVIMDQF